eukprot:CAMPEP_0172039514 /NCGR_PEP_ID=MMETSP1041-20130122/23946_1 /TAXON_ID=464988 /ORGANISM="Hemiselmis andersenii, Strain CCMP439" /LENGTH=90 /DNA_ID=CAMNT_0012697231 /DNA_START=195 /DNA_END=463 /DNA_ORIENTATION=+
MAGESHTVCAARELARAESRTNTRGTVRFPCLAWAPTRTNVVAGATVGGAAEKARSEGGHGEGCVGWVRMQEGVRQALSLLETTMPAVLV